MYNVLINNLSTVSKKSFENNEETKGPVPVKYTIDIEGEDNKPFEGYYTNEAVSHALLRKFSNENEGEKLDLIYSLASDTVLDKACFSHSEEDERRNAASYLGCTEEHLVTLTHYKFYKELIKKWVGEEFVAESPELEEKMPEFRFQRNKNIPEASDIYQAVLSMGKEIIGIYQDHYTEGCRLYLDYTGGDRTTAIIILALTKLLEERGIQVDHIWAVNFMGTGKNASPIKDKTASNYIFDLISGLREFKQYGRADTLNKFLKESDLQLSPEAKKVEDAIDSLADAIQLCRSAIIIEHIGALANSIDEYAKWAAENPEKADPVFDYLVEDIRDNYQGLIKNNDRTIPHIIRWCLEKNLIQQAVTMYTELLPSVLYAEHIIYYTDDGWKDKIKKDGREYYPSSDDAAQFIDQYVLRTMINDMPVGNGNKFENIRTAACNAANRLKNLPSSRNDEFSFVRVSDKLCKRSAAELLCNYQIMKKKVRNALNHASSNNISVKNLEKYMCWKDKSIFEGARDMTVPLLTDMMKQLLDQLDEIICGCKGKG